MAKRSKAGKFGKHAKHVSESHLYDELMHAAAYLVARAKKARAKKTGKGRSR